MTTFKKIMAGLLLIGVLMPSSIFAQTATTTSASVQATLAQIQTIETQIKALQAQHEALMAQYKILAQQQSAALVTLIQTLKEGSTGDQVAILQALLALDPSIYPEGIISGFFGRKTSEAVRRFQRKHGIDALGFVGPKTLKKLNELLKKQDEDDDDDEDEDRDDDDDRDDQKKEKVTLCHRGQTKMVAEPSVFGHLRHGDTRGACSGTTPTDVIAPTITLPGATGITSTSATIGWTTNEGATSQVEYGLATPYTSTTTLNTSLVTAHTVLLSGLTPSTLYHFRIRTKDGAGNLSTTADMTFTTSALSDTTAPAISGINVSAVGSTTATVGWTTNENATGKVYYGLSTPVNFNTFISVSAAPLTTGHSFVLTALTASTTYFYALESTDASNNTATTTTLGFITTN